MRVTWAENKVYQFGSLRTMQTPRTAIDELVLRMTCVARESS